MNFLMIKSNIKPLWNDIAFYFYDAFGIGICEALDMMI
jgi:hypothetical protein